MSDADIARVAIRVEKSQVGCEGSASATGGRMTAIIDTADGRLASDMTSAEMIRERVKRTRRVERAAERGAVPPVLAAGASQG